MKFRFQNDKKVSFLFRVVCWFVWLFTPKYKVLGEENIPDDPCIIVGNHSQIYGPVAGELHAPGNHYVWCIGQMMDKKDVPEYAFNDFWSAKPKYIRWFFKLLSYIIAPLAQWVFTSAHTIAVYHDVRLKSTYRNTVDKLSSGFNVVIFPEYYEEYNNIIHKFQDKFIDVARFYYKKEHKELSFVPCYLCPRLSLICYGKPIKFNADAPISAERVRINNELMRSVTDMAVSLPVHTVVPYPNIPKREYPKNVPLEMIGDASTNI